ncbi:MAG: family 43 glycosylhydrolase [Eubacterium sp.]|nr:family 43 glycosylhydrolase [Eubacterium sp.]
MRGDSRDYLTGLYNRQGMYEIWKDSISKESFVQVVFIDVDNFKMVNDMYGHKSGDKTLIRITQIICQSVKPSDFVIRLGGDEFVVMRPGKTSRDELKYLADSIMKKMAEEGKVSEAFEVITLSMGILWNAEVGQEMDNLLSYSDAAMYFAKEQGKNRYIFFDEYEERIRLDAEMESTAQSALENGRFGLVFYPVVHLQNSKLLRTVALTVWNIRGGDTRGRKEFERALSGTGFVRKIDIYSFRKLCGLISSLYKKKKREVRVCIQLSDILMDENVVSILSEIMEEYKVDKEWVEILVSENMFERRNTGRIIKNLGMLKDAGFYIGLTDFGGDFSSFRYIERLPFSSVFFDEGYLGNNMEDENKVSVLSTLFHLTRDLHLLSVGQEINNLKEAEFLIQNGCDGASGPYFSSPLELGEYLDFISGIIENKHVYKYAFKNNLSTTKGEYTGEIVGGGIEYVDGISDKWGGLSFGGGPVDTNLVRLPGSLLLGDSFTITMWLRPKEIQNWISAIYIRHKDGFTSFMPSVSGNLCMFRMHPDGEVPWTDNVANGLPLGKWSHVSLVYDAFSKTTRMFIDGKFVKMRSDIPEINRASSICLGGDCYQVSYRGDMSALCIYDAPLSGEEIYEHYMNYRAEPNFRGDDKPVEYVDYMAHDPAIFEDPVTGKFYIYATSGEAMVSEDMEHWDKLGKVVEVPEEAKKWTGSDAIWAPDIVKVGDEYRLYCSNSSWGVQQSCIFLAVSDKAQGPFEPKGIVFKSDDSLDVNAIDANIIEDHETKEQYLLYGSFWDGVHLLPLDKDTGYLKDDIDKNINKGAGICLARRPLWTSGSIEGPYMIYLEETGYYYLFVSYGSLRSDYNIRVGRSRKVTGPFLDYFGNDMADNVDDDCTRGLMIAAGYRWITGMPYMGPGHNSVLKRADGEMFLVSHIRKLRFMDDDCGPGLLQIRRMFGTPDGWLMVSAQPYARETYRIAKSSLIPGVYERIELRPSIPQGVCHAHPLKLYEDGRLECCSIIGEWKQVDEFTLEFIYGPIKEYIHVEKGLDRDVNKTTVVLSGLTNKGICTWAKKRLDRTVEPQLDYSVETDD